MLKILRVYIIFTALVLLVSCNDAEKSFDFTTQLPELCCHENLDSNQINLLKRFVVLHRNKQEKQQDFEIQEDSISYKQVAELFYTNCKTCHRDQGTAPFAFNSYYDLIRKAKTIKKTIKEGRMPPWTALPCGVEYSNEPEMTQDDIYKILKWYDMGALCSEQEKQQPLDELIQKNKHIALIPDIVATTGYEHTVSENSDMYHCKVVDLKLEEGMLLKAIKPVSSNPRALHHITVYLDTMGILGENGENWDCYRSDIVYKLIPFDTWSKGFKFYCFDDNFSYYLPKKSKLMLQVHYDEHMEGQTERTSIHLYKADNKPFGNRRIKWMIQQNADIYIPADSVKVETITHKVEEDISLLSVIPHMHYIGRMIEVFVTDESGKRMDLLKVDDWDYPFQGRYMFKYPIKISKGSIITSNVVYDNTSTNPYQPNFPPIDAKYELGSKQEMMVLTFYYVDYKLGDEKLKIGHVAI